MKNLQKGVHMRIRELYTTRVVTQFLEILSTLGQIGFGTAGTKIFSVYDQNGVLLFDVENSGVCKIGGGEGIHTINGTAVSTLLEVHSEGENAPVGITVHNHGDDNATSSAMTFIRSRGTHAAQTAVIDGSILGRISGAGHDGTDEQIGGQIEFVVDGTPGNNDMPASIRFLTTSDGQGTPSERLRIKPTGEFQFFNSGSLAHGCMHGYDLSSTITITGTGQGNKVQITSFAANGHYSPSVIPDHTEDHITIGLAGKYKVDAVITAKSTGAQAFKATFSGYKNNGTTQLVNLQSSRDFAGGGGDAGVIPLSAIVDLSATDTLELWVWNNTNTEDIVITDISMNIFMVGA